VFFYNRPGRGLLESARHARIDHVGNSRSLVPLDLEGDGDIDLLIFDVLAPAALYENVSPGAGHYLVVEARGTRSNRNGVGARVFVTADGRTQMREIVAGGSFYAGPPLEAHFGLGAAQADELRVLFPSGVEVRLPGVGVDQRLVVVETAD
jgi:hypothetical protein